ncbi:MAG: tRNA (adenosine(37)-N6)-threonylcarbamoyltransferase complex transferase subunit TsaD, partial [Defluviitaleaceae bacterium]|nr:tRNA (adenosine(37)-N6)-threonylcarbamoyltransferase complex transferase subunit TsaD [Defluviitaleaceae bacterium]
VDVLVQKSLAAAERIGTDKLAIAGGVAANSALREKMAAACDSRGIRLNIPPPIFCTDNAAMIAACGYYKHIRGHRDDLSLNAYPSMPL